MLRKSLTNHNVITKVRSTGIRLVGANGITVTTYIGTKSYHFNYNPSHHCDDNSTTCINSSSINSMNSHFNLHHTRNDFRSLPVSSSSSSSISCYNMAGIQLDQRRFNSGTPFPSLKSNIPGTSSRSENTSTSTSTNTNTNTNTNTSTSTSTSTSTNSMNSPWKHFNMNNESKNKSNTIGQHHGQNKNDNSIKNRSSNNNNHPKNNNNNNKRTNYVDKIHSKQNLQQKMKNETTINNPKTTNNQNNTSTSNNNNNNNNNNNPMHPLDKLKDSFMQSLKSDRERRRNTMSQFSERSGSGSGHNSTSSSSSHNNNSSSSSSLFSKSNNNTNTESKLDQLLRMSRERAKTNNNRTDGNNNNNNYNNNHNNNYHNTLNNYNGRKSGAKAFRESRKMRQQQQQQNQNQNQNQQFQQTQGERRERYQNRMNTNTLHQELLRANASVMNHEYVNNVEDENNEDDDRTIILPRKDMTLVEVSSLFRVHKDKILKTMKSLGESIPKSKLLNSSNSSDNVEEFKIDVDMAELIALELGLDPQRAKRTSCQVNDAVKRVLRMGDDEEEIDGSSEIAIQEYPSRPPVVCIMGHVDHGKTTLMDSLRQRALEALGGNNKNQKNLKKKSKQKSKGGGTDGELNRVAGTEAGGITQKVSAFQVALTAMSDSKVTFLDTPGHAAFKAMRQSGSNGADVIVLIVAADDGVSPQTVEIINMYKSIARSQPGSISLVVAMTKIDKPGVDVRESMMRIENQLMEHDIYCEHVSNSANMEFNGVQMFPVSGITGDGLDELIEGLALQSEIMDLRADNKARAEGLVIDAKVRTK